MPDYESILVATDLSDPSLAAVREAGALARRLGSRLILAYVMEDRLPPMVAAYASETPEAILKRHREHAEAALADFVKQHLADHEVERVVLQGVPHQEIVRLAAEHDVGLLVVGMHGHGFLAHALAGSTAERILHHAPCPVLVVSHDKSENAAES